jgi:hypothetical protein
MVEKSFLEEARAAVRVFAMFFGKEDSEEFKNWRRVSRMGIVMEYGFAHTFSEELAESYGVAVPGVVIFKKAQEDPVPYTGDLTDTSEIL